MHEDEWLEVGEPCGTHLLWGLSLHLASLPQALVMVLFPAGWVWVRLPVLLRTRTRMCLHHSSAPGWEGRWLRGGHTRAHPVPSAQVSPWLHKGRLHRSC